MIFVQVISESQKLFLEGGIAALAALVMGSIKNIVGYGRGA